MQLSSIKNLLDNGLSASTFWSRFKNSEFYNYLVTFISQIWFRNTQALELKLMEGHISQAQHESSIRAHAQDRAYIPKKRIPTKFVVEAENNSDETLSVPNSLMFSNQSDGLSYFCPTGAILPPKTKVSLEFIQAQIEEKSYEITLESPYIEILFDYDVSKRISSFKVSVTEPDEATSKEWAVSYLFRNTTAASLTYVERTTALGQHGFMFGDGVASGKIPSVGSIVNVQLTTTEGDVTVVSGQNLIPSDDELSKNVTFTTGMTIVAGSEREDSESIRKNAQYNIIYDNKTVWEDDYRFFFNRNITGLSFLSVWGEQGQEELKKQKKEEYRCKIYVCAYHPKLSKDETRAEIQSLCDNLNSSGYNKVHEPAEVSLAPYTIAIKGKTLSSRSVSDVVEQIKTALAQFTENSATHNGSTTEDDVYDSIRSLNLLTGFKVQFSQDLSESLDIDTFRYLDLSSSSIEISY